MGIQILVQQLFTTTALWFDSFTGKINMVLMSFLLFSLSLSGETGKHTVHVCPILSYSVRLFEPFDHGTEGPLICTPDLHVDPPLWFLILRYPIISVNLLFHSLPSNFCCRHGKEKQEASAVDLCNSHLRHLSADQL